MFYPLKLTDKDLQNFICLYYKEQIKALNLFYSIIENTKIPLDKIAFGGGTALAIYYFQHRLSFDIDLFVSDTQYMNFLSPKLWINEDSNFNDKYIEQAHHIGLNTKNNIKIDILSKPNPYKNFLDNSKQFFKFDFYICSLEDIIANKIIFRKMDNKTRDIFDIAVSLYHYPNLLKELLEKNILAPKDVNDLRESLLNLNEEKYRDEIIIVEPFDSFKNLANNAYQLILEHIDELRLNNASTQTTKLRKKQ